MAEVPLPYDKGDESGEVPAHATTDGRKAPLGVTGFLDGSGVAVPVTAALGLPASQVGTWTVTVSSLPSGLATSANQATAIASLASIDGKLPALVSGRVPVDGSGVTQPVSIAGTVAVSGPLTDAQLRASAVPVSLTSTTITGTVAATQSGTWNVTNISGTVSLPTGAATETTLASIDGKTPALGQALAAGSVPVVLTAAQLSTLTPPAAITGFATESTLSTLNGKITACDTGAVTISAALPAGTNTIGKLAANDGVDIGDVTINNASIAVTGTFWQATQPVSIASTVTVTGAGGTFPVTDSGGSLTVDAPVGTPVFVRLSDGASAITTLPVSLASVPSHDVTNAGTFAVQVTSAPTTTVTGTVAATQSGTWTVDLGATDNAVLDAIAASVAGTLTVGTHAVTQSGSWTVTANAGTNLNTSLLALESGGNLATAAALLGTIDADTSVLAGAVSGSEMQVDIVASLPAGTNTIGNIGNIGGVTLDTYSGILTGQYSLQAPAIQILGYKYTDQQMYPIECKDNGAGQGWLSVYVENPSGVAVSASGTVAHDSVDSGNPVKVGARAAATLADDTMVANGDRTDAVSDLDGAIITRGGFPLGDLISERTTNTDGASTAFTNFGATASTRNYVTAISLFNSSATAGYIDFRDGTGGSVLWTVAIPAGGGAVISAGGSPLFRTSANTALAFDVSAALSTVYISVTGFKSKV